MVAADWQPRRQAEVASESGSGEEERAETAPVSTEGVVIKAPTGAVQARAADYAAFIASKHPRAQARGFEPADLPARLFPWQREAVAWACHLGTAALFEECGLGKTLQQLAWAWQVARHTGRRVLIVAPLAVAGQTIREAQTIGLDLAYAQSQADVSTDVVITNYDRVMAFDAAQFAGVVLDESSILKNFTGVTRRTLTAMFAGTPFRLACTATPSPNDHMELGNHSEFLGLMPANEMLMRWFINDTMNFGSYRLKKHAAKDFWRWVASWAVCASRPSDLGGDDDGFELLPLDVRVHQVESTRSQGDTLFDVRQITATSLWRERSSNLEARVEVVRGLCEGEPDEPWVVWCDTNDESAAIAGAVPGAVEVRGSHTPREKESRLLAFARGETRVMVTKPDIAGFGMNWQHCARQVFAGVTYSFERTYQALRRSWRFGQTRPVVAHFVYAEGEADIWKALREKQASHEAMQASMSAAMRESGFSRAVARRALVASASKIQGVPSWLHTKSA